MPYKPKEIRSILTGKLGMTVSQRDHTWFLLTLNNLPTIKTKLPNHKGDIGPQLENRICKELRVRKVFFYGLMDCSKYLKDYDEQIRSDPYPPFDQIIV